MDGRSSQENQQADGGILVLVQTSLGSLFRTDEEEELELDELEVLGLDELVVVELELDAHDALDVERRREFRLCCCLLVRRCC